MWAGSVALVLVALTSAFVTSLAEYHFRGWRNRRRLDAGQPAWRDEVRPPWFIPGLVAGGVALLVAWLAGQPRWAAALAGLLLPAIWLAARLVGAVVSRRAS